MASGQPIVENGHRPEENQVSRTSGSCTQPSGAVSPGPRHTTSPSGPYQIGMRWPHHSWREMVQSCMLSTHSNQRGSWLAGWMTTWPLRTASPAALASASTLTHHCIDRRGSIGSPVRSECPTLWM
ncbi:Uncharacterised protein [Mycobacteroides abscessus subsp. abscessus]|nr:Uncharacterised protein [Mycobacteroides abscessus subsp. abscessus]